MTFKQNKKLWGTAFKKTPKNEAVLFAAGRDIKAIPTMGIVIVSLSTAYAFAEFFGVEGSLDAPFDKGRLFYRLFLAQLVLAGLLAILPSVSLFRIVFYTQSANGVLLPFVFYFLLKIANNFIYSFCFAF